MCLYECVGEENSVKLKIKLKINRKKDESLKDIGVKISKINIKDDKYKKRTFKY